MKHNNSIFSVKNVCRGGMLVELLMSIALAAIGIPFLMEYQKKSIVRAENIAVSNQINLVQDALEKYMIDNRNVLLTTVGKNITRVEIAKLAEYGLPDTIINDSADKYQLRILKSMDYNGMATLQGIVVMTDSSISPMRTREIVNMGGDNFGFVDGTRAYGAFGIWRTNVADLGINADDGLIGTTTINRDNAMYLWRVPSTGADDATMMTALNLGGHDVINSGFVDAFAGRIDETLHTGKLVADNMVFQTRTAIDTIFTTQNATCNGSLSSDARNMNVGGTFTLSDVGKFSSFTTNDLWVTNLTLAGLSIGESTKPAILKVNQNLDMTSGRVDAMSVTVGYTGSVTPRLVVKKRIQDSQNANYYWDIESRVAHFNDVSFPELNRMAQIAIKRERVNGTDASTLFGAVATNKNATAADYMNAINEIQSRVRAKYSALNLQ